MLSNRTLVLGSAAIVAVVTLLLSLGGGSPEQAVNTAGDFEVQSPQERSEVPRVVSVSDYVAGLKPAERKCFDAAVGEEAAAALAQGSSSISEPQLKALNDCVNPTLPNPAAVVQ